MASIFDRLKPKKIAEAIKLHPWKYKKITEASKSVVSLPKNLKGKGEIPPFNYKLAENVYKSVPYVFGAINKTVDSVVGTKFTIIHEDQRTIDICMQFIKDHNFDNLLREVVRNMLVFGNAFVELVYEDGNIVGLKCVNPKTIYIERNESGEVIHYYQARSIGQEPIEFEPQEIAHFKWNIIGDSAYGYGIIYPHLEIITQKLKLEKDMATILRRKSNSPVVIYVGNEKEGVNPDMVNAIESDLESLKANQEWVLPYYCKAEVVDTGRIGEKLASSFDHYEHQLTYGFEVPEVLMGKGSIPEGLAKEQRLAWLNRISSIRQAIEQVLEKDIFKIYLENQELPSDVEFEWESPSEDEKRQVIQSMVNFLSIDRFGSLIPQEIRLAYYEKIAELQGIDVELPPEVEREKEQEEPQPRVPVDQSKRKLESFEPTQIFKDCSIEEWVGFNYTDYLDAIDKTIDGYDFIDPYTGAEYLTDLSPQELMEIKSIMKRGFQEGQSVNQMSRKLEPFMDKTRANKIIRTEIVRMSNEGALSRYKDAKVNKVKWVAALSDRTCPECEDLNGHIMDVNNPDVMPPVHAMCRCQIVPIS